MELKRNQIIMIAVLVTLFLIFLFLLREEVLTIVSARP